MENFETEIETETAQKRHGNDRHQQVIRESMDRLIGAVDLDNDDVDEYNVLGNIMVRAGIMWKCLDRSCNCINHLNALTCDNCGRKKAKSRDIPKADIGA